MYTYPAFLDTTSVMFLVVTVAIVNVDVSYLHLQSLLGAG